MRQLRFDWDPAKASANLRKRGVGFEEARTVFEDAEGLIVPDPDHSAGEERFVLIGLSSALRVLVVIHCDREDGDVLRIISARKAGRAERGSSAAQRRP